MQLVVVESLFLRKDNITRERHMVEQMVYHMSLMMKEIQNLRTKISKLERVEDGSKGIIEESGSSLEPGEISNLSNEYKFQQEFSFTWGLIWCDPKQKIYSGSLTEAFGGKWGFAYGSKRAGSDDIPIFIKCHDLPEKSILVDYGIAVVDSRTGEEMKQYKKLAREFQKNDEYGYTSLIKLSDLEKIGAFDKAKGLTTLLFRARLRWCKA